MGLFDPDHDQTRRDVVGTLIAAVVIGGMLGAAWWAGAVHQDSATTWVWPLVFVPQFVLSLAGVKTWLERGRRQVPGVWRTSRATRLTLILTLPLLVAWQFDLTRLTLRLWREGDVPRGTTAGGLILLMTVFIIMGLRNMRATTELTLDARGIDARAWRGLVPWSAIAEVSASRSDDTALDIRLKPEAMGQLPRSLRANGLVTRLSVDRAGLTAETALEAVAAVRPDLIAAKPRSAGLVLPVRGATDIVEADL